VLASPRIGQYYGWFYVYKISIHHLAFRLLSWKLVEDLSASHPFFFAMAYDYKFGPQAQTPEQRAWVLQRMQEVMPSLKTKATAHARQLYAQYIAGELSWVQVRQALNAATPLT